MQRLARSDSADLLQLERSVLKASDIVPEAHQHLEECVGFFAVLELGNALRPETLDRLDRRSLKRRADNLTPEAHADDMEGRRAAIALEQPFQGGVAGIR